MIKREARAEREADGVGENFITFNPAVRARLPKTLQFRRDYEGSGIAAARGVSESDSILCEDRGGIAQSTRGSQDVTSQRSRQCGPTITKDIR